MKCELCGGSGWKLPLARGPLPGKHTGDCETKCNCHERWKAMQTPCPACNGTGQQPEAPAPAAPAELAAKLTALAIVHQEYAPTLLEAAEQIAQLEQDKLTAVAEVLTLAEQLQRQAAVVEAARGVLAEWRGDDDMKFCTMDKLEAALAAMEATDGR